MLIKQEWSKWKWKKTKKSIIEGERYEIKDQNKKSNKLEKCQETVAIISEFDKTSRQKKEYYIHRVQTSYCFKFKEKEKFTAKIFLKVF